MLISVLTYGCMTQARLYKECHEWVVRAETNEAAFEDCREAFNTYCHEGDAGSCRDLCQYGDQAACIDYNRLLCKQGSPCLR
jgi:hypothetical protein